MKPRLHQRMVIILLSLCACTISVAQSFTYTIQNEQQISDRTLVFDLYLLNTNPTLPIAIAEVQAGILVNPAILNGGTMSAELEEGYSDLQATDQHPTAIKFEDNCVKVATRVFKGCENSSYINSKAPGTRLCRVKLTNTVPFAAARANLNFSFSIRPYATKLFYYNQACISTRLTTDSTNCFSLADNPVLNSLPVAETTGAVRNNLNQIWAGGVVTESGSPKYSVQGFVYSSSQTEPTLESGTVCRADSILSSGSFSNLINGGNEKNCYLRAYASNVIGTAYGSVVTLGNESSSAINLGYAMVYANMETLTIDLSKCGTGAIAASLLDAKGRRLWSKTLQGGSSTAYKLPLNGVYMIKLAAEGAETAFKIVY